MKNMEKIRYTFLHRYALEFVIRKHIKDENDRNALLDRAKKHDLDKAMLYTLIDSEKAHDYHVKTAPHHMEKINAGKKERLDIQESIMDFESAGYTKADKPLNAYDTVNKFQYGHKDRLTKALQELHMDRSYKNTPDDPEWQAFLATKPEITEDFIEQTIRSYVKSENPEKIMDIICFAENVMAESRK